MLKVKSTKCVGILIKARPCLTEKCLLDLYYTLLFTDCWIVVDLHVSLFNVRRSVSLINIIPKCSHMDPPIIDLQFGLIEHSLNCMILGYILVSTNSTLTL